jgi:N-acetylneuraminate synthase
MTKSICIDGVTIGENAPPYVIAEMSANHNGNIDNAFKIIDMSKLAGASAVKMQTYTPDTLTIDCEGSDFQLMSGLWAGRSLYELYAEAYTPWDWHQPLFEYAKKLDITIFSTPFDSTAVDFLEDLGTPAYKIASFEAIDIPLIRYVAQTQKPMIISTGMANLQEIEEAVDASLSGGCKQLALLHCVSGYPAPPSDYNLRTIADLSRRFNIPIGLSDHTLDNSTALASISMGASIIEKHVTLDRLGGGPDDSFSLESEDLQELCRASRNAWLALGRVSYERASSEADNIKFRRSLYFVEALREGDLITEKNVRSIRPGYGLPPKYLDDVIGRELVVDVAPGTAVQWDLIR